VQPRGCSYQEDFTLKGGRHRADFPTRKAAELWEAEARAAIVAGRPVPNPKQSAGARQMGGWTLGKAAYATYAKW
jgi:hypothetical protein